MDRVRRQFVLSLGAGLAACTRASGPRRRATAFDLARLDREFPALAQRARPAMLNAGVVAIGSGQTWCWDQNTRMPMQGVIMAPLAAAALAQVDAGQMTLNERIHLTADDLSPQNSRIDDAWPTPPEGHALDMPVVDLIALAIQDGDNTAADAIMKRLGGPTAVTAWLHDRGVVGLSIDRFARDVQQQIAGMPPFRPEWKDRASWLAVRDTVPPAVRESAMSAYLADPRDTTTVPAALDFLRRLSLGTLISANSTRLLLRLMSDTSAGAGRLRAGLPRGAVLARKTGTAGTDLGLTPAVNDIGLVTLEDGRQFAVAAFLAGSTATETERDRLIADAARLFVDALQ